MAPGTGPGIVRQSAGMSDGGHSSPEPASKGFEGHLERHGSGWLATLCFCAFLLTYHAAIDASFSDPWGTLLTSQAILEHGTIRLDAYAEEMRQNYEPVVPAANGHVYSFFPLGSPLFALPAVWLARQRGEDMIYPRDNEALQNVLSSLTVVVAVLLIQLLCRRFLSRQASLTVTAAFVFGTTIASTLGTALWSSNLALLLRLGSLLILTAPAGTFPTGAFPPAAARWWPFRAMAGSIQDFDWQSGLLGVLMFLAYLCRPTEALLFPLLLIWLWTSGTALEGQRRTAIFVATAGGLFGLFVLFSLREYGSWLPPYYLASRLGSDRFWEALVGHMVSPSRGLLVGSPFLILALGGLVLWPRRLLGDRLVRLALGWIVLHWLTISNFHNWWGGWSFGARLFTEALPAFLLLTVRVVPVARARLWPVVWRSVCVLFLAGAAFGAFVHSHQGLYNTYAILWNEGIDRDPSRVFNWHHPQFLASPESLGAHAREHRLLAGPAHGFGEPILPTSTHVVFEGWSIPEGNDAWRWSDSTEARIVFKVNEPLPQAPVVLEIEAGTYQLQEVAIRLNGSVVGYLVSERNWDSEIYRWQLAPEVLRSARRPAPGARIFELELEIPGAVTVGEGVWERQLGVCLRRVTLRESLP